MSRITRTDFNEYRMALLAAGPGFTPPPAILLGTCPPPAQPSRAPADETPAETRPLADHVNAPEAIATSRTSLHPSLPVQPAA
ncbi:hypothetical protein [Methylobacterium oxalidis]|uniref:Uncharacterized protein n=1 Tax=Methylobacterium oxalidis TaxID=944322 RepID=A0A512J3E0_9HYPH|nr:hypothetical protein [Methylobacterium oxalidis]GEP04474.1 hypothetical protein MOX02_25120 [Methylobacterium oxalidis]GLS64753.1 hypothetical protein GCM10007888_31340 [Methylobacterium oxalidis]